MALELAQALAAVHLAGGIHKDINPSYILLEGPARRAVLTDFHIACCCAEERQGFTQQSHIAVTPVLHGQAPLRTKGRSADRQVDRTDLAVSVASEPIRHNWHAGRLLHFIKPA